MMLGAGMKTSNTAGVWAMAYLGPMLLLQDESNDSEHLRWCIRAGALRCDRYSCVRRPSGKPTDCQLYSCCWQLLASHA